MISRRQFGRVSVGGITLAAAPAVVRGQNLNSRLQVAGIGCDGKGWGDIREMSEHDQTAMVGFCDIDMARTEKVRQLNPDAPVFQDYKEMLGNLDKSVDAVTVSTPDHMHAYITLDAMRKGKHVYCQKPLTHNVWEARQVGKLASQNPDVITRMGNQIHSHTFYRTAVAAIQSGVIGKIKRVHSWASATGHGKSGLISAPKNPPPLPESVDWDLWTGVAPMRPYGGDRVYHPWGWRDWQDFGNGALGDFGCHILDPVFTALEIKKAPTQLQANHSGMNDQVWPAQTQVDYVFPGTSWTAGKTLDVTWYDGGLRPGTKGSHIPPTRSIPDRGSIFIGETGTLVLAHMGRLVLYREDGFLADEFSDLDSLNHYHGWVDGCIDALQPSDGFGYAAKLTEAVLLGNIAVRFRKQKLTWDEDAMSFIDHDDANSWLRRDYRHGWDIQEVA